MQTYHKLKENKRGQLLGIVLIVGLLFLVLIIGFIMMIGSSVTNYVADNIVPDLSTLGVVGDTNLTAVADYTIVPANNIVQSFTWLTGVIYFLMLIGCLGVSFMMRETPNKWLIGFFFLCVLLLTIGSIFISNMYEAWYNDSGEFSTILREHTILSWLILYSPMINVILAFISGIILFSGRQEESYI
jgi:hypothetical protein